jgi:hypothetical protein
MNYYIFINIINIYQMKEFLAIVVFGVLTGSYIVLAKPAIVAAQMTYENGFSIKNFSALL